MPIPPPSPMAVEQFESGQALRCRVCGSPGASKRHDMLCWVCRRLKISAWKDVGKISLPE
jgi:ribosomal protein S14